MKNFPYENWEWSSDPLLNPLLVPKFSKERRAIVPLASSFVSIHVRVDLSAKRRKTPCFRPENARVNRTTTWEEAHDAHVLDYIMTKMEQYVETASDPEKVRQYPWLANWAPIK